MVTIIDNLNLDKEAREWYERILELHPLTPKSIVWLDLEPLTEGIMKDVSEDDVRVLVATGGVEVYNPREMERNVFVFKSPNFGEFAEPSFKLAYEDYERITSDPVNHHQKELQKLKHYLSNKPSLPLKIIEGDIGNSGLSAARLLAIYQSFYNEHPAEILIGAAPEEDIFKVTRRSSLILFSGNGFYKRDLRNIMGLTDVPYKVIIPCKDAYIRRASEIMGVTRLTELDEDVKLIADYYERMGLSGQKLKDYIYWYTDLTKRKLDRAEIISKKVKQLERISDENFMK